MGTITPTSPVKQPSAPQQQTDASWKLEVPVPIVGACITVVGAFLVAIFADRRNKMRERAARFAAASKEFRTAFADELTFLLSDTQIHGDLASYLAKAFTDKHSSAVIAFEAHVPPDRLAAFRAAWEQYHSGHKDYSEEFGTVPASGAPEQGSKFSEYSHFFVGREESDARLLAIERIRHLLSFANGQ